MKSLKIKKIVCFFKLNIEKVNIHKYNHNYCQPAISIKTTDFLFNFAKSLKFILSLIKLLYFHKFI